MGHGTGNQNFIPRPASVPERDHLRAEELSEQHEMKTAASAREFGEAARGLIKTHRDKIKRTINTASYGEIRRFLQDERSALRRKMEPPEGPKTDPAAVRKETRSKGLRLLRRLGVSTDDLAASAEDLDLRLEKLAARHQLKASALVKADAVPDAIRTYKTNPWALHTPPFAGWQQGFHSYVTSGFSSTHTHFTTPSSGLAGNEVQVRNLDASDADLCQYQVTSQIGFWHRTDGTGLIETWIEAQPGAASHYVGLVDEWGWSSARATQTNFLMMHALHPDVSEPDYANMSYIYVSGTSRSERQTYLIEGNSYWAHLFSDAPIPANTWTFIRCGTLSQHWALTNDVSVWSDSTFKWSIKAVHVRTAP